ncbi:hypothetical protein F0562_028088 [Nyssa sinensis]|uniref:Uncharacterized protein n=1 Tax=Nyssa sinensis TaxID=561372 RepID=A0A5J5B7S1_9ASTE|nr:hypothetical protein F0562_028088 [Nyssa sinensis]
MEREQAAPSSWGCMEEGERGDRSVVTDPLCSAITALTSLATTAAPIPLRKRDELDMKVGSRVQCSVADLDLPRHLDRPLCNRLRLRKLVKYSCINQIFWGARNSSRLLKCGAEQLCERLKLKIS